MVDTSSLPSFLPASKCEREMSLVDFQRNSASQTWVRIRSFQLKFKLLVALLCESLEVPLNYLPSSVRQPRNQFVECALFCMHSGVALELAMKAEAHDEILFTTFSKSSTASRHQQIYRNFYALVVYSWFALECWVAPSKSCSCSCSSPFNQNCFRVNVEILRNAFLGFLFLQFVDWHKIKLKSFSLSVNAVGLKSLEMKELNTSFPQGVMHQQRQSGLINCNHHAAQFNRALVDWRARR